MCNGGRAVATTHMYMLLAAYLAVLIVVIRVLQRVLQAHTILSRLRGRAWSSSSPAATVNYSCPKHVPHICNSRKDNGWFAMWPEDELAKKGEQIAHSSAETDTAHTVASELDVSKPDVSKPVNDDRDLDELRKLWLEQIKPRFEPLASADPFLSPPDVDNMYMFVVATDRRRTHTPHLVNPRRNPNRTFVCMKALSNCNKVRSAPSTYFLFCTKNVSAIALPQRPRNLGPYSLPIRRLGRAGAIATGTVRVHADGRVAAAPTRALAPSWGSMESSLASAALHFLLPLPSPPLPAAPWRPSACPSAERRRLVVYSCM